MRFGWILLVLLFAVIGAAFGALNSQSVAFDFYFDTLNLPKGAALVSALLCGWLLGGLLCISLVSPFAPALAILSRHAKQHEAQARGETTMIPLQDPLPKHDAIVATVPDGAGNVVAGCRVVRLVYRSPQQRAFASRRRQ